MSRHVTAGPATSGPGSTALTPVSGVLRATTDAIHRLRTASGDGVGPDECRRIDRTLRDAVERHSQRHGPNHPGLSALRVACAHLAAADVEDAYLALLTARDLLR